jgi:undecaprenyl-diphosphatase
VYFLIVIDAAFVFLQNLPMEIFQVLILAIVQGLAELLPVSSSAHVILAQRLMGLDPGAPAMTFLLVMLHTGTMFAVIVYFWKRWKEYFLTQNRMLLLNMILFSTLATAVVGFGLKHLIETYLFGAHADFEIEHLFRETNLIAAALVAAGILILWAGSRRVQTRANKSLDMKSSLIIGIVQGVCLPFRGFSRSGATISAGLLLGVERRLAEEFSFLLAVVLTPPVILRSFLRLKKDFDLNAADHVSFTELLKPGLLGMVLSFFFGFIALKLLTRMLERGQWKFFGFYCLGFAGLLMALHQMGLA